MNSFYSYIYTLAQLVFITPLVYFLSRDDKKLLCCLLYVSHLGLLACYYDSYVIFYNTLLDQFYNTDKYSYVRGVTKTSERYALTKTLYHDIVYESSYTTITFGDKDSFMAPHWTSENNHMKEKNKRSELKFSDDLVIGDHIMSTEEWYTGFIKIIVVKWDRGPLDAVSANSTKIQTWHVYPGSNFQILAQYKHDYYDVIVMYNGPKSMAVFLSDNEEFHKTMFISLSVIIHVSIAVFHFFSNT